MGAPYDWPQETRESSMRARPLFDGSNAGLTRQLNRVLGYLESFNRHCHNNPQRLKEITRAHQQVRRELIELKSEMLTFQASSQGVQ